MKVLMIINGAAYGLDSTFRRSRMLDWLPVVEKARSFITD